MNWVALVQELVDEAEVEVAEFNRQEEAKAKARGSDFCLKLTLEDYLAELEEPRA